MPAMVRQFLQAEHLANPVYFIISGVQHGEAPLKKREGQKLSRRNSESGKRQALPVMKGRLVTFFSFLFRLPLFFVKLCTLGRGGGG